MKATMARSTLRSLSAASAVVVALVACGATEGAGDDVNPEGNGISHTDELTNANLLFEGTCEFLRTCSTYSRGLPAGEVLWGCEGRGDCDDDDLWIAAPRNGALGLSQSKLCGRQVKLCRNGTCVTAKVRDRSVTTTKFEGSVGVMRALGISHGLSGRCSGYGGGTVSISLP
jgi:predicted small secreted protein